MILPDHLHCIWSLPDGDDDFSLRWRQMKSEFSRQMPKTEKRSRSRKSKKERGIWQRRFWEHTIRDERDYQCHVDYIHFNPVKHGYVLKVVDSKPSLFHRFVKQGVYPLDWVGSGGGVQVCEMGEVD